MSEQASGKFDSLKLLLAIAILIAGIVGYYYFEEQQLIVRVLGLVGVVIVAIFVASMSQMGRAAWGFARDSRGELSKIVWPARPETTQLTLLVLFLVILLGLFLWAIDSLFGWIVGMLVK